MVHLQSLGLSNLFLKTAFASYKISGFETPVIELVISRDLSKNNRNLTNAMLVGSKGCALV
jgi:hypothetical protein